MNTNHLTLPCPPCEAERRTAGSSIVLASSSRQLSTTGSAVRPRRGQKGSTTVAVAISMVAVVSATALVIDIGNLKVIEAELQTVADLAAKSAAQELARVYISEGREDPLTDTLTATEKFRISDAADRRARINSAGGTSIVLPGSDVTIGKWNDQSGAFEAATYGVNAVQVTARRDETSNGIVNMFFAGVFGTEGVPVQAGAASRLSGIRYLPKGTADFPVAIAKAWYAAHASPCTTGNKLTFHPTGSAQGCVGWHTFEKTPANAAELKSIVKGLRLGTFVSPEIDITKSTFEFTGGTLSSVLGEVMDLYNAKKNAKNELPVLIPVYDRDDCSNPSGPIRILGVARAVITHVDTGGDGRIEARVQCDVLPLAESGGPDFGVLAGGPDLVR
ncbi:MAG: TadG family pilus assembly protein [Candidatus Binatia bacterium]